MNQFYQIDSTRVSLREYLWWHKSPLVIFSLLHKWLHLPTPCSSDDPNTESTRPFIVESLPPEITAGFAPLTDQFTALGFSDPVFHVFPDPGTRATIYWATFRHESGRYFARLHRRIWRATANPNRALFPLFFTAFTDGTFLISSAGKPDMAAPQTVVMNRMPQAPLPRLWEKHRQLTEQAAGRKMVLPVNTREDLAAVTEQHHLLVRDFHLARGVFRIRTPAEQSAADTFAAHVAEAQATGVEPAGVMAELEKLQTQPPGWGSTLWVLAGSLVVFIALGAARWNWKFTLWIIPVLLFHELGHWAAMRVFHYRNLRMFFIPLFGAAVTGQNWNVPGWKKALVSLAGPLPGIALGVGLGTLALIGHIGWLNQAALLLVFLNGFNLLPFLPLDGGQVMHTLLFCRHRWLDVAFRVLAAAALFWLSVRGLGNFFLFLAILMALGLPLATKLARVRDALRKLSLPPPRPNEDRIPVATAQVIIAALQTALPKGLNDRALAQRTVAMFESLNARPPGVLGTLGLLLLHGGAFLVAFLFCGLLWIGSHGGLGDFAATTALQPKHPFQCGHWRDWPGDGARTNPPAERVLWVATFKNQTRAEAGFAALTNQVPADSRVTWFGDSVMLELPAGGAAVEQREFDQFQTLTTNLWVAHPPERAVVNLSFVAPTTASATNLMRELARYIEFPEALHLIPPWSPAAAGPEFAHWRLARREWRRIGLELAAVSEAPAMKSMARQIQSARGIGNEAEAKRLETGEQQLRAELEARIREKLRTDTNQPIRADFIEWQAALAALSPTNQAERAAIWFQLAPNLGQVECIGGRPAPGADAYGAGFGRVSRHGLIIEISQLPLNDAATGLPALSDWLCQFGCQGGRYDLFPNPSAATDDSD
jgi:Zn-dependent protease